MPLPLACRLPNPPASFVGRAGELDWLRAAIERAPVTFLHGEAGVGKSALVLASLKRDHGARLETTLYVRFVEEEHPALPVLRALFAARGVREVDWRELLAAPEGLVALAIDLAEESDAWLVLDDLHRVAPGALESLIAALARYARRSRWLCTARVVPPIDELRGQSLRVRPLSDAEREELARLCDPSGDDAPARPDTMQALRALAAERRFDELASLLERTLGELLSSGFALSLWSLLEPLSAPAIEAHRLRVALELGDRDVLARLREPQSPSRQDRLLWVSALVAKGRFAEARALAERSREDDPFQATFLEAQAAANLGALEEAFDMLGALDAPDAASLARRDGFRAQVASLLLRERDALACVERARARLGELRWPERGAVGTRLSLALYNLGRLREASAVLDEIATSEAGSVRFDVGRRLRFLSACIALDRGDFARVSAELAALEPWVGPSSPLRANLENARGTLAAMRGDLEELDRAIAALRAFPLSPQLAAEREVLELRACLQRRLPPPRTSSPGDGSIFERLGRLHRARAELHAGVAEPSSLVEPSLGTHPEERVLGRLIRAEALLACGRAHEANVEARDVAREAEEQGFRVYEAEALSVACDVLAVLGDHDARKATALELLQRSPDAPRLMALARLHAALDPALDPSSLEGLAASSAPEASLRARAILGEDVAVGVLDRLVLGAFGARVRTLVPGVPGFGVDPARRSVWLASGERVSFERHALLFRLLEVLAVHGGHADKERLVVEVWGERSYHPLKHDNRLHAAVRKLRKRLGDASLVLTTDDGYALGRGARVTRAPA